MDVRDVAGSKCDRASGTAIGGVRDVAGCKCDRACGTAFGGVRDFAGRKCDSASGVGATAGSLAPSTRLSLAVVAAQPFSVRW